MENILIGRIYFYNKRHFKLGTLMLKSDQTRSNSYIYYHMHFLSNATVMEMANGDYSKVKIEMSRVSH